MKRGMNEMKRRFAIAACAVFLLVASTSFAQTTPAQLVQRHLDWLEGCRNYRATITVQNGDDMITATGFVDTRDGASVLMFRGEDFPEKLHIKSTRLDEETVQLAYSLGLGRDDDLPFMNLNVPYTPFSGGIYDLFVFGQDVSATMSRIDDICADVVTLDECELGKAGLRIVVKESVIDSMRHVADQLVGDLAGEDAAALHQVQPGDTVTLWFNGEGRLDAVEATDQEGALNVLVKFEYEEFNLPDDQMHELMSAAYTQSGGSAGSGGSTIGSRVIDGFLTASLPYRLLLLLSVIMVALSAVVIVRVKRLSID